VLDVFPGPAPHGDPDIEGRSSDRDSDPDVGSLELDGFAWSGMYRFERKGTCDCIVIEMVCEYGGDLQRIFQTHFSSLASPVRTSSGLSDR
jgi:hypothetical protein